MMNTMNLLLFTVISVTELSFLKGFPSIRKSVLLKNPSNPFLLKETVIKLNLLLQILFLKDFPIEEVVQVAVDMVEVINLPQRSQ
jgi:hypothetical protein